MFVHPRRLSNTIRTITLGAALLVSGLPVAAENLANLADAITSNAPGAFGFVERQAGAAERLPQWRNMFERMRADHAEFSACVANQQRCATPQAQSWRQMFLAASGQPQLEQLRVVNAFFNRLPYRADDENYGTSEYWASPSEFLKRSGDCEDYSIAKYLALRQLGFATEQLRLVAVMDTIRGIGHAVLTVRIGGKWLVLDSLSDGIFADTDYAHYIPRHLRQRRRLVAARDVA